MNAYEQLSADDKRKVETLLAETRAKGGLAPLDLDRFWAENEAARKDCFKAPTVAFGAYCSNECIFEELGIAQDFHRLVHDQAWRLDVHKKYNDVAERIVGKRLLAEKEADPNRQYPQTRHLHDVFEGRNQWVDSSYWLHGTAKTPDELQKLLDRVDKLDIRSFILPDNWEVEKKRLMALGVKPNRYRGQRGPVTLATSIYGAEELIYLILDEPDVAIRFRDTILRVMLDMARIFDEENGQTPQDSPRGWWWADDNCCLLTADMYELFGYPILKGIFDTYSPDPEDQRFQHSDSAMGHLLPLLGKLNLTGTNFGPTLTVTEIRQHLPRAVIQGQLAPFTFSRNEERNMVAEFLRDFNQAREKRGLWFATAGSVNNGSRLTGMRLMMAAVQRYGRY